MKIIFAGTPVFAEIALEALIHSTHEIVAVYTQPDKPAGRGLKLSKSPVKELALQYGLPIQQPKTLKDGYQQSLLATYQADVMVVAAYGMLLPSQVLNIPKFGCINIHPSLLPRWRGAAPIQRTIFAGDTESGVSIMQMDEGLDTGPILLQTSLALAPDETSQSLHDKLAKMGAAALLEVLDSLAQHTISPIPQQNELTTYAHKISKEEALIDWLNPASELAQMIRAFNPWPVAFTSWRGANLRVWFAKALTQDHHAEPRTILAASKEGIDIACGQGVLRLLNVQIPGKKAMDIHDFYNAHKEELKPGSHFI